MSLFVDLSAPELKTEPVIDLVKAHARSDEPVFFKVSLKTLGLFIERHTPPDAVPVSQEADKLNAFLNRTGNDDLLTFSAERRA